MSNSRLNTQSHPLSKGYNSYLNILQEYIFSKAQYANISTIKSQLIIQVGKHGLYQTTKLSQPCTTNNLTEQQVEQIEFAIEEPQKLSTSVRIYLDKQKLFQAQNGLIILDTLNLSVGKPIPKPKTVENLSPDEIQLVQNGKLIAKQCRELLAYKGIINQKENSVNLNTANYLISVINSHLKVQAKESQLEVLNDYGFTENASSNDIERLQKVGRAVEIVEMEHRTLKVTGLKR
jgi:hypothetical protein